MFVKCIFEEIERHRAEKSVTLTRPAIAGQLKTAKDANVSWAPKRIDNASSDQNSVFFSHD